MTSFWCLYCLRLPNRKNFGYLKCKSLRWNLIFLFREAVSMMVSHVLKFVDLPKTKKATNLENETLFFFKKKNKIIDLLYVKGL